MKKIILIFGLAICSILPSQLYAKKLKIFACEPEWQAVAQLIGKNKVKTFSATSALQNPHYIRARPSLIAKIKHSDLLICSGASLEQGWLPILLQKANYKVQKGQAGHLMAADFVPLLGKMENVDRSMGDVHPEGNPHIHLNPHNILLIAAELTKRLKIIDKENANFYQNNYNIFSNKWRKAMVKWELQARNIKNMQVIPYHKSFDYLFAWLDLKEIATIEPKPGLPASASHLRKLLGVIADNPQAIIVNTPYDNKDAINWLGKKTNMKKVTLPYTVGANQQVTDLFALFSQTILLLNKNYGK